MIVRHICLVGILVVATAGLELTFRPSQLRKKTGENFAVQCAIKDDTKDVDHLNITSPPNWHFLDGGDSDHKITTTGRNRVKYINLHTTQLMITNAVVEDAGTYKCEANVGGLHLTKEIRVDLYRSIEMVDFESEQHPVEDDTARILCQAISEPKPEIYWYKKQPNDGDSEILIENGTFSGYSIQQGGQALVIENFKTDKDNGVYKCTVNLIEAGSFNDYIITVTGYVKPRITATGPESKEFDEGSSAELTCAASGTPAPQYKWFKADKLLNVGDEYEFPAAGKLRVIKTTPADAGDYKCEAFNQVGQAFEILPVKIFLLPKIVSIENVTAKKDESVEIPCSYNGGDPLTAVWLRNDKQIAEQQAQLDGAAVEKAETNHFVSPDNEKKTLTLHIEKATVEDMGEYHCHVSNKAGKFSQVAVLAIEHKPIFLDNSPGKLRAIDTSTLELHCSVDALPMASWTWTGPHGDLTTEPSTVLTVVTSEDQKKSSLKVNQAVGNYGNYTCKAHNSHGPVDWTMEILKIEIPNKPDLEFDGRHPIKARLLLKNYRHSEEEPMRENLRPTKVELRYTTDDVYSSDISWDSIEPVVVLDYNSSGIYELTKLKPNTKYFIAVRGENEAGKSDWIENSYDTPKPERPDPPSFVTLNNTECLTSSCSVDWLAPEDGGSSLTGYVVVYGEDKAGGVDQSATAVQPSSSRDGQNEGSWVEVTVGADIRKLELKALLPKTRYRVRVYARNVVDESLPSPDLIISTREFGLQDMMSGGVNAGAIVAIVVIVVLIIVLLVDVACYYVNQCGLLMCVCVNCCGKTPPEVKAKEVDLEHGKILPEDKKPLRDSDDVKGDQGEDAPMIATEKRFVSKKDTSV